MGTEFHPTPLRRDRADIFIAEATIPFVLLSEQRTIKIAFCDPISSQRVMRTELHPTPLLKDRVDNFIAETTIPFLYFLTDNGKLKLRFVTPYLFEFPKIGFCELQLPQDIVLSFFAMSYLRWRY